ncbi:MAG TPA: cytochrome c, partial [Prosthecobacter sp.]|nr:cytochrome c [Prosthecobacter sp.]
LIRLIASARHPAPEALATAAQVLDHPMDKFLDYALKQAVKARQLIPGQAAFARPAHAEYVKKIATAAPVAAHPGKAIYDALCLNCHQPEGKGLPGIYPSIAASDWVNGDPARLIQITLHGLSGPIQVNGQPFAQAAPLPMPPMGLDDRQTADVLTWLRASFGNDAPPITPAEVQKVRAAHAARAAFWTAEELGAR